MSKYIELQTRKLISSYGGVGSIIETINGSLIVKDFDKWVYFRLIAKGKIEIEENELINDDRLLKRLQYFFPDIKQIVKVPANYSSFYNTSIPKSKEHIINAEYFPKWMYCNNCGSFKHITEWYKGWKNVYYSKDINKINDSFIPPKCYKCYKKAKEEGRRKRYYELEQVRFILIAPNGEIKDLPWDKWTNITREKDEEGKTHIKFNGKCCNKQDLYYHKSTKFADFSGVRIECKNPECKTTGKQVPLAGLFGLRIPDFDKEGNIKIVKDKKGNPILDNTGNPKKIYFKPVIRTSNSVYYPLVTNSIYLPSTPIKKELKEKIKTLYEYASLSIEEIKEKLSSEFPQLTAHQIEEIISPSKQDFTTENEYRLREYQFLVNNDKYNDDNLVFEKEISNILLYFGINKLLKVKRLKLTSVQTGFSRQEPIDKDLFSENSMDDFIKVSRNEIKPKYTSSKGKHTTILPGVESFGEGIFIDFTKDKFSTWFNNQISNKNFNKRLEILIENALHSEYRLSDEKKSMLNNKEYLARFIFTHTFSHILIKELEFLTGYPATSISERLYINEKEMQGILIYTIAGSEGSFGGLVSQAETNNFIKIIKSALVRAKDCSSDPICFNSDGQGIGGLNLAACYSCSLLPETSCEEFNSYLDRAILIDKKFGYYKNI
ncbi:MAG: DrmB family protein [Candidatus Helarchaeota archaeon]